MVFESFVSSGSDGFARCSSRRHECDKRESKVGSISVNY